jgi:molybdate transport system substrate-binding protein
VSHPGTLRVLLALTLAAPGARAAEIYVMNSGGFAGAYKELAPGFERQTGNKLAAVYGPSMGETPEAIPNRLARGEAADVVILARSALDALVSAGRVRKGSEVDLVRSRIGLAVKAGAPRPDISSVEGLKRTLLNARSIAYSDSASGVYVAKELFARLGIAGEVASKSSMIPATPVGLIVARGEAEVGFQQISELLPIAGIQVVGPIPEAVQKVTVFSAGIATSTRSPEAARRLIEYLASRKAWRAIRRNGLQPISEPDRKVPKNGARAYRNGPDAAGTESRRDQSVAARPITAAADSHTAGIALLPVISINQVAIIGVNPPNSAVARL